MNSIEYTLYHAEKGKCKERRESKEICEATKDKKTRLKLLAMYVLYVENCYLQIQYGNTIVKSKNSLRTFEWETCKLHLQRLMECLIANAA